MSEEQESYRPRSPDLSEFVPRHSQPSLSRLPSFRTSDSSYPPGYAFSPRGSYDASPYFSPQTTQGSYFASQTQTARLYTSPKNSRTPSVPILSQHQHPSPRQTLSQDQTQPRYPPAPPPTFNTPTYQSPATYQPSPSIAFNQPQVLTTPEMARTRGKRPATYFEGDDAGDDAYDPSGPPPAHSQAHSAPLNLPAGPLELSVDVKTKFPVARIKRIMQADEDVGKVAQATPTAVAKALELFMITLVAKGASEARQGNSKRITAQHLKTALMADQQFDFLGEQCANIPDESAGGSKKGRAKSEAKSEESDEEMGGAGAAPRKKSKAVKSEA